MAFYDDHDDYSYEGDDHDEIQVQNDGHRSSSSEWGKKNQMKGE